MQGGYMEEERKAPRKIYLIQRIGIPLELLDEFNQFWRKNTLPFWEQNGAKFLVTGRNLTGGPSNEITRIFEFENIHHWEKLQEATWDWWEREGGPGRAVPPTGYVKYLATHEQRLVRAVYSDAAFCGGKAHLRPLEGHRPPDKEGQEEAAKKAPKRVYVIRRINVRYELVNEFNQFWKKNTLPLWEKQGAQFILAGSNVVGGFANEITQVFEFESIHHWEKMQEALWDRWENEGGPGRSLPPEGHLKYLTALEQRLLRAIY
jgi:hypothetical protein